MSDCHSCQLGQQLKDKQAGQVCYQLYLRDTKENTAV